MRKLCLLIAASGCFALAACAQVTNVPPTELQTFEARTGTVIVEGAGQVGALVVDDLNIAVVCKESMDSGGGPKQYGLAIEISENNQRLTKMVVDYDELDSLVSGLNYLGKIDYNITTLPTFVAGYVTKSGLRVGAYTSQQRGAIQYFLQDYAHGSTRILITATQLAQFQTLIEEARKNLDSLRAAR
jgi:hypothetical protein